MKTTEVDAVKIAAQWDRRGFSCDLWLDPLGQHWEGYVHDVDELLMLIEGALELECDIKTVRPAIGEELFIPAHTVHSVRNIGETAARWLYGYRVRR